MSAISQVLYDILHARFGKDVRQAIHDGIELGYNIASDAKVTAETAQDSASASATSAANSASAAQTAANNASISAGLAEQYKEEAFHTTPAGYEDFVSETNSSLDVLYNDGVKNILPVKSSTATLNGVTFIVNSDGTVIANGTATATAFFVFSSMILPAGKFCFSGSPQNGSDSSYSIKFNVADVSNYSEYGNTIEETFAASHQLSVQLRIANGFTANNVVFKPMITLASVPNSDYAHYVPYAQSNAALTENLGLIRRGRKQFSTSVGSSGSVNVTFDFDFDKVPTVLYSIRGNDGIAGVIHTSINDVTSTGFKLNWKNTGSAGQAYSPYIEWVAIMYGTRYDDNT